MQISKLLLVVGMGIMSLGLVSVRADDTPAQAAARAALMEKMAELDQADAAVQLDRDTGFFHARSRRPGALLQLLN